MTGPAGVEYYDRKGKQITMEKWSNLHSELSYRVVAQTSQDRVQVSTVWLGIDHRFDDAGDPLIFETLVFGGEHDDEMLRYSTEEDALQGHFYMCKKVFRHTTISNGTKEHQIVPSDEIPASEFPHIMVTGDPFR